MKIVIGFTGTRSGMKSHTIEEVERDLGVLFDVFDVLELHHGDCEGADFMMHVLFEEMAVMKGREKDCKIVIHPPTDSSKQAKVADKDFQCVEYVLLDPKPYLKRDHDIVDACDFLFATPKTLIEERRSGTWATIRYARKKNRKMRIYG